MMKLLTKIAVLFSLASCASAPEAVTSLTVPPAEEAVSRTTIEPGDTVVLSAHCESEASITRLFRYAKEGDFEGGEKFFNDKDSDCYFFSNPSRRFTKLEGTALRVIDRWVNPEGTVEMLSAEIRMNYDGSIVYALSWVPTGRNRIELRHRHRPIVKPSTEV